MDSTLINAVFINLEHVDNFVPTPSAGVRLGRAVRVSHASTLISIYTSAIPNLNETRRWKILCHVLGQTFFLNVNYNNISKPESARD